METENKIILPKSYLSWSSLNCWLSNPKRFRREYFEGLEKLNTRYLQYGKGIAKLIEEGKHKELLPDLITYASSEFEIRAKIKGIPVLCYLDSYDPVKNVLREYKTGTQPWDMARVQKHDQLTFYAAALKSAYGKMPEYCDLDWIETKEDKSSKGGLQNSGAINVTGRIISFHREFDERELERIEDLILKVAEEISDAYKEFIKEL